MPLLVRLQSTRQRNVLDAFVELKAKGQVLQVSRQRHIVKRHVELIAKGQAQQATRQLKPVSYTHLRAHET